MNDTIMSASQPSIYLIALVFATPAVFGIVGLIYARIVLARLRRARVQSLKPAHAPIHGPDLLISKNEVLTAIKAINRSNYPRAAE